MDKYPLDWLKLSCEKVYCRSITDRTWRKWLRLCQVLPYSREIDTQKALWLLTLAYMKKLQPCQKITLLQIKFKLKENPLAELHLAEAIYDARFTNAKGRDLPEIILRVTGKQVALRTLYRWAQKQQVTFQVEKRLTRPEVEQWIRWATA
ncbi:hypothetical protein [Nostoc sp. MG11]|uniref:hypothetical protein n=1 Tax=Nostoc sp. MG11 TaxID=2721166 RepID=UPI001868885F|nr:hypothetical protein [Nostoc sp. MG11]